MASRRCLCRAGRVRSSWLRLLPRHPLLGFLDFLTEDDVHGSVGTHDRNFRGWAMPKRDLHRSLEHTSWVRSAMDFAEYHSQLRHGGCRVGEQHLRTMANDSAMFLCNAWHKAGDIHEGEQRNVEGKSQKRTKLAPLSDELMSGTPDITCDWLATIPTVRLQRRGQIRPQGLGVSGLDLEEVAVVDVLRMISRTSYPTAGRRRGRYRGGIRRFDNLVRINDGRLFGVVLRQEA